MHTYTLYYDTIRIGTLSTLDNEFPNLCGNFSYDEDFMHGDDALTLRIREFLTLQAKTDSLLFCEDTASLKALEALHSLLDTYDDMSDSIFWCLEDDTHARLSILVPLISEDHTMTWRWQ